MRTLMHEGSNRILPSASLYYFSSYGQNWYRVLMLEDGYYLRVQLTPLNPTVESEWDPLLDDQIQWGGSSWTMWGSGKRAESQDLRSRDHYTRTLPEEVVQEMHERLGEKIAEWLLTGNLWGEIEPMWPEDYRSPYDVTDWFGRCGYNGGIALAKMQKHPPTYAEIHAAEEQKRHEECEARIAAAVGSAEPLSEAERALGKSLEGHDWAYNYSDDGSVWRRGRDHQEELTKKLQAMTPERARLVWKAFVHPHNEQYWTFDTHES